MTKEGGAIFYRLTRANVQRSLAIILDNAVYSAPYTTLAGLAVMAAGIPLYLYFGRKNQSA